MTAQIWDTEDDGRIICPVFVVGGGPSIGPLIQDGTIGVIRNLRNLGRCGVITSNEQYKLFPEGDGNIGIDPQWWRSNAEAIADYPGLKATACIQHANMDGLPEDVQILTHVQLPNGWEGAGLQRHKDYVTGNSSGQAAINWAYHLGARKVILIGFDMHAPNGRCHYYDDKNNVGGTVKFYNQCIEEMGDLAREAIRAGLDILNATEGSKITCFRKIDIHDYLEELCSHS